jgi:hypothetical protein
MHTCVAELTSDMAADGAEAINVLGCDPPVLLSLKPANDAHI